MNEFENYDANFMPLSNDSELRLIQEKVMNGSLLTLKEKVLLWRDYPIKQIDGYELRLNCVYRAISEELYQKYLDAGFVYGVDKDDEYLEYTENGQHFNNNRGVDYIRV